MVQKKYLQNLRHLLGKDELKPVIQELSALLKNNQQLDEVIQQSARWNEVKRQIRLGVIDYEEANLTKNQIRAGLLGLLEEIEDNIAIPELAKEVDQYIKGISGKNIVSGSTISAGGNVTIGDQYQTVTESKTSRNVRVFLLVFVPIIAIGAAVLFYQYRQMQQPLSLAVSLENLTPNPNLSFKGGKITLVYGGKPEPKAIDRGEEIVFRGIPANYRREQVQVKFEADGFASIDTTIHLNHENLILPIRRDDTYARLFGVVSDEATLLPLEGVIIKVQDLLTKTDENGIFDLSIPFEKQRLQQRLSVTKKGYRPLDRTEPVVKNAETLINLQKIN